MSEKWWQKAVAYQIYPKSFQDSNGDGVGDIPGITSRLPYLAKLGIDVIWLSPVYASPMDDNGYDISDYQAIAPVFGTMDDFDTMLATAHELGIRIVMDLVVNHTSDEHRWFKEACKGKDNPYHDYYIWRDPVDGHAPNNCGAFFGGSVWEYVEECGQYYLHFFSKKQPDLNWENPQVRDEVFNMMDWWLQKGVDGFRMDVICMIAKNVDYPGGEPGPTGFSSPAPMLVDDRVHDFLREMNRRVLSKYDLMTVGECGGVTVEQAKKYANLDDSELSMIFQFEHVSLGGSEDRGKWTTEQPSLVELKKVFSRWETELEGIGWNSLFWSNHDQPRAVSRWVQADEQHRELAAKMLGTCLHLMKGTPYIYEGEELGMTNFPFTSMSQIDDLESHDAFRMLTQDCGATEEEAMDAIRAHGRDNSRTPMQWDATPLAGFTTGKPWLEVNPNASYINVAAQVDDPSSVFAHYQRLVALRHESELVRQGTFRLLLPEDEKIFAYERELDGQRLLVACNFTADELAFELPAGYEGAQRLEAVCNYAEPAAGTLRPFEAFALVC